jgi:hypothetical protein
VRPSPGLNHASATASAAHTGERNEKPPRSAPGRAATTVGLPIGGPSSVVTIREAGS